MTECRTDDPDWWCFITVGMYACTRENPHPAEHGCGPAIRRDGTEAVLRQDGAE